MLDQIVQKVLSDVPMVAVILGGVYLIVYILKEYARLRKDNDESIQKAVDAKLGAVLSSVQVEVARLQQAQQAIDVKVKSVDSAYETFETLVSETTESIEAKLKLTQERLGALNAAIPDVDDYGPREILGIAQQNENTQVKTALCKRLLNHKDSSSLELEVAGDLMRDNNRTNLALGLYQKSHDLDPERNGPHIELLALTAKLTVAQRDESFRIAKSIVIANPNDNQFKSIANSLMYVDRYAELLQFAQDYLAAAGDRSRKSKALALRNIAVAHRNLGDIKSSIATYNVAFEILPDDENTIKSYLSILDEIGDFAQYCKLARRLVEIDPSDTDYYFLYIKSLVNMQMYDEADNMLSMALTLPTDPMRRASFAVLKLKINAGKTLRATSPSADASQ